VIHSWGDSATRRLAEGKKARFSGIDEQAAVELLAALDAATSLKDLSPLKSVNLHKLVGDRKGFWAMTINGPWRLCFRFHDGDAFEVQIVDYHTKKGQRR
jgi:proteic killer suppression protein